MSKKLSSTLLLFLIGAGFAIYSITTLIQGINALKQTGKPDEVIQGCLYMIPAVAAFGALIMLPFKSEP